MTTRPDPLLTLYAAARGFAAVYFPGVAAVEVSVVLDGVACPVRLPVPRQSVRSADHGDGGDRLTESQLTVLRALEGVAMKTTALEMATGMDHGSLFRALRSLREPAMTPPLVAHSPRLGYYRTDCPPAELAPEGSP